ncbi:hypothetical protein M0R19_06920 [Candidatus Pacearchaeota archaeon]|jgi:hypothetical protein|nr:hypothetical protein [Candidatus Pacearchaeota archaeon]
MNKKQKGSLAVACDGIWAQQMSLFIRDFGLVRLVAWGSEEQGMYLEANEGYINEANMFCSLEKNKLAGGYSIIEMSQSDYKTICNSVPKKERGGYCIRLPSQAESIIKRLIHIAGRPTSLF